MIQYIQHKDILFITTKNLDYIRNVQEINIIKENATSYQIIGSDKKIYFIRILAVYFKLLFCKIPSNSVIFVGFAPQLIIPFFKFKFHNHIVVEDFFISLYDTLCCDRNYFQPNGLLGKLLHNIDKYTLNHADYIISDTNSHGKYFSEEFDIPVAKLHTLYLQADAQVYSPKSIHKPEKYKQKYIVLYFGSVLPLQGIEFVLKAYNLLKTYNGLHMIFIGPITTSKLNCTIPDSPNIEYIKWLPQNELANLINSADLCLAGHFHPTIEKAKRTIPGKAYIYKACKKPMILGDTPANHELFDNDSLSTFVPLGDAQAIANAILEAYQNQITSTV